MLNHSNDINHQEPELIPHALATYLTLRSALQPGFYAFLIGAEKKRLWIAILISNLISFLPNLYPSPSFALLVLIPSIFWRWLFFKRTSLTGVSVSHIFIGVWMVFSVGFGQLLNQLSAMY